MSKNQCVICDIVTGKTFWVLRGHATVVQDIALSPNGSLAVTAGDDMVTNAWSLHTPSGGMWFSNHKVPVLQASFLGRFCPIKRRRGWPANALSSTSSDICCARREPLRGPEILC